MPDTAFAGVCNDENYNSFADFITNHQNFTTKQTVLSSFKNFLNYSEVDHFLENRFPGKVKDINENMINVTYDEQHFAELATELQKYGIIARENKEEKVLSLTYDKTLVNFTFAPVLKFSGKLHLTNPIEVAARLVIFDNADFIGENQRVFITKAIENKNAYHVYIHGTKLNNLWLNRVDSIWMSGNVKLSLFSYNGVNFPLNQGNLCQTNIAKDANIEINDKLKITSNCINIEGNIIAKTIDINSMEKHGELYISNSSRVIGIKELFINGDKLKVIQNGLLAGRKFSVLTNNNFYNNGTLLLGDSYDDQAHDIRVHGLFNQENGEIQSFQQVKLTTYAQSGNLGTIKIKQFNLTTPSKIPYQGVFYNNGLIMSEVIAATSDSRILNDNNGTVISSNNIAVPYSMINKDGHVITKKIDMNFNIIINNNGSIFIAKKY